MKELMTILKMILEELRKLNDALPVLKAEQSKTATVERLKTERIERLNQTKSFIQKHDRRVS
ncbi:MAG: hypothetical protein HQM12_22190 [SAR324 cluster bacterium]|nr:hypothetical protein [SAR324 cluster bacterium]